MPHFYLMPMLWDTTSGPFPHWRAPGVGLEGMIDLRPESAQAAAGGAASGFALCSYTAQQSVTNQIYFGADILGNQNNTRKNQWRNALGFGATALTNSRLDLIIAETLGDKSDPTWTVRSKPILPNAGGRLEIHLGTAGKIYDRDFTGAADAFWPRIQAIEQSGYRETRNRCLLMIAALNNATEGSGTIGDRLILWWAGRQGLTYEQSRQALILHYQQKYKRYLGALRLKYLRFGLLHTDFIPNDLTDEGWLEPETTITESFNTANSDTLGPDLTWTESGGDVGDVDTNQCLCVGNGYARAESDLSSSDHYGQVVRPNGSANANSYAGPMARYSSSADTAYYLADYLSSFRIAKLVTGTPTNLGTGVSITRADGDVYKLQCSGTTITSYLNAAQQESITDSAVSTGTRGGMILGQNGLSGANRARMDSFEAADLAAASSRGIPFGARGVAFNGGRTLTGVLR